nr:phosphodiester glycosidase family protein [Deinococcus sp. KSM4-11]
MWTWSVAAGLGLLGTALARPVAIGGFMQSSSGDTRVIGNVELIPVSALPRLGVAVRNDPQDLRLVLGARELRFSPVSGWKALGFTLAAPLALPQVQEGNLLVPLSALTGLGVVILADTPNLLDFAAPAMVPAATLPPSSTAATPAPAAQAPAPPATPRPAVPAATPPATTTIVSPPAAVVPVPVATPPVAAPTTPTPAVPASIELQPVPMPAMTAPPLVPGVAVTPPPVSTRALANLDTVRVSRSMYRTVEVQRVVLEFSDVAPYSVGRETAALSLQLPGVTAQAQTQALPSGDTLAIQSTPVGSAVRLDTAGGKSSIFTLDNPYRIVVDTVTYTDSSVPPPLNPSALPDGVTYTQRGGLHLLSFDPDRFQPRVVSAPVGRAVGVADLVRGVGGVAGVNGGYFDPASNLPVDLVALGGVMTSGSLEKRGTVGFTAQGQPMFGYPRPRYVLGGAFGTVTVNAVRAKADPALLTAFVGDGHSSVGGTGFLTLQIAPGAAVVARADGGAVVPPAGTLAFSFDPLRFPQLPHTAGDALTVTLNWQASDAPWNTALDALGAGPLLVAGGRVVLDAAREGFNTAASIWRPTRQVGFGVMGGRPVIAFLEYGTPDDFASALAAAGVQVAVRLDSGSSATAYLTGGYGGLGGYLNTVWSRAVPNAIVFVPRTPNAIK